MTRLTILDYDPDMGGFSQPAVLSSGSGMLRAALLRKRLLAEFFGVIGRGILG